MSEASLEIDRGGKRPAIGDGQSGIGSVDLEALLDQGRWTLRRASVTLLISLAVVLDGLDSSLLGLAVPQIAAELGIGVGSFSLIFACGLAGMSLGTVIGGLLGDRIGRRLTVIGSVVMFSLPTIAIAWCSSVEAFGALRFVAGLGLGALMPNGGTLVAEFTPARWRNTAVMLSMMCIAVGSMIAGLLASGLIETLGWRGLFVLGGCVPLGFAILLLFALPESPRFLARKRGGEPQLIAMLLRLKLISDPQTWIVDPARSAAKASIGEVLHPDYRRDALMLSGAFFCCMLSSYSFNSWLPAVLTQGGIGPAQVGLMTAVYHMGGIVGIAIGSLLIMRIGSRLLLGGLSVAAVVAAILLTTTQFLVVSNIWAFAALLVLEAAAIGTVQVGLYSVAVHVFPSPIRATGVGLAVGLGRIGALASAFVAGGALNAGGPTGYFVAVAIAMTLTLTFLLLIRRHTDVD